MGKKRKLRKQMRKRGLETEPCIVICGGSSCAPRHLSRELVSRTRAYALAQHPKVHVEVVRCLNICKKGPIVAVSPEIRFYKRVEFAKARALVDKL
ncbi:MAG: (2Fe-2S) ferredoxin domain-containing protein, partial [Deltaproteobacteria bacterium]|nr:(2Fe-2S) ferredoxin domain-containing protein [Deltaproteobacteria bacterium]